MFLRSFNCKILSQYYTLIDPTINVNTNGTVGIVSKSVVMKFCNCMNVGTLTCILSTVGVWCSLMPFGNLVIHSFKYSVTSCVV